MNHKAPRTYELNEKPPVPELIPLCLQHVLLFLASTLAIPLIIGSSLGFSNAEITLMLQCSIFIAGVGTILQSLGVGPVGNRLPIILGATFTFVTPAIAISQAYGFPAFIGRQPGMRCGRGPLRCGQRQIYPQGLSPCGHGLCHHGDRSHPGQRRCGVLCRW